VGARVALIAENPCRELEELAAARALPLVRRAFATTDLDGVWLALLVDRDFELGARMAALCNERRILFCAIDQPQDNSFSHMALARAGLVTAAIGTNGRAPALGRRLREELERVFDEASLAEFAERIAELRETTPPEKRREVLSAAVATLRLDGRLLL
jgi:siroheme synthase-like protein